MAKPTSAAESTKAKASFKGPCSKGRGPGKYTLLAFLYYIYNGDKVVDIKCTVADYRLSTVRLQVKTLLPCILHCRIVGKTFVTGVPRFCQLILMLNTYLRLNANNL